MNQYLFAFILLAGQFIITYATSYFTQKGKNAADKDDIAKLTQIMGEVNSKFTQENEKLKASLSILVDKSGKSFSQEQQAIIAFYSEVNKWIWEKTRISIHEYGYYDIEKLNEKIIDMDQTYSQVNVYNGTMDLLVNDNDLSRQADELIIEALKLHQFVEGRCKTLKTALIGLKSYEPLITVENLNKMRPTMLQFTTKQIQNLENDKEAAIKDFYGERGEYFKLVFIKLQEFKKIAKSYLLE